MVVDPRILAAMDAPLKGAPSARPFKTKGGKGAKSGYAATPGTGPSEETCGTCQHLFRKQHAKVYLKCGLIDFSGGPATDIRSRSPACSRWQARNG